MPLYSEKMQKLNFSDHYYQTRKDIAGSKIKQENPVLFEE
jgi:hypothetical protein